MLSFSYEGSGTLIWKQFKKNWIVIRFMCSGRTLKDTAWNQNRGGQTMQRRDIYWVGRYSCRLLSTKVGEKALVLDLKFLWLCVRWTTRLVLQPKKYQNRQRCPAERSTATWSISGSPMWDYGAAPFVIFPWPLLVLTWTVTGRDRVNDHDGWRQTSIDDSRGKIESFSNFRGTLPLLWIFCRTCIFNHTHWVT